MPALRSHTIMSFQRKLYTIIKNLIIITITLSALVVISNVILKRPTLSFNDLHIMWIVSGKNFFVNSNDCVKSSDAKMVTNDELQKLNGGKDCFIKDKKAHVFRIFCIGGSTTRGWPFNPHFSYPLMLSLYLQDLLLERKIEIINAGFCASDSSSDIPLVREILNYQPDLILVHEGINESHQLSFHTGYGSWIVKAHMWLLRHVYVYNFLKNRLFPFDARFNHAKIIKEFLSRNFKFNEKRVQKTFLQNIKTMSKLAQKKKCPILFLTQVLPTEEIKEKSIVAKINDWLREFASRNTIMLIDIDRAFRESGEPAEELIIPVSIHPDLKGYMLMAKTICRKLAENDIIAPQDGWRWENLKDDSSYLRQINLTPDFLSLVYRERLGDLFKQMNMPRLADRYYRKAERYLQNGQ